MVSLMFAEIESFDKNIHKDHRINLDGPYTNCTDCGDQTSGRPYCDVCLENHIEEISHRQEVLLSQSYRNRDVIPEVKALERAKQEFVKLS